MVVSKPAGDCGAVVCHAAAVTWALAFPPAFIGPTGYIGPGSVILPKRSMPVAIIPGPYPLPVCKRPMPVDIIPEEKMQTPPLQTILLIIAGVAVLFWPQFVAMVKSSLATFKASRNSKKQTDDSTEKTRAEWVTDLMELHDLLIAAGEDDLAKLCCDLCNGLICVVPGPSETPVADLIETRRGNK